MTKWTAACQPLLSSTISWHLFRFMSIELVMLSNHLVLYLSLLLLPSIFPIIRVFSNESALCIRWPKYWSFTFRIVHALSLSRVWLFVTRWTVACQAPQSTGFSRQEYWGGLPFPSPGLLQGYVSEKAGEAQTKGFWQSRENVYFDLTYQGIQETKASYLWILTPKNRKGETVW